MARDTPTHTKARLVDAATHVFAARGYASATVREITDRAGANQAAINYHFGDKSSLYTAAVSAALSAVFLPLDVVPSDARSPASLVRAMVADLVHGALREERAAVHVRLLTLEVLNPTGAIGTVFRDALDTRAEQLGRSLARLESASGETRKADAHDHVHDDGLLLAHWILGSCLVALQLATPAAYGTSDTALREQDRLVDQLSRLVQHGVGGLSA